MDGMRNGMRCAVVALVLAGCSSEGGPPTTVTSVGPIDGVPADRYDAAVAEWDAAVDEWNALAGADRQTFESYQDWARAQGKPLTFEDVLSKYR